MAWWTECRRSWSLPAAWSLHVHCKPSSPQADIWGGGFVRLRAFVCSLHVFCSLVGTPVNQWTKSASTVSQDWNWLQQRFCICSGDWLFSCTPHNPLTQWYWTCIKTRWYWLPPYTCFSSVWKHGSTDMSCEEGVCCLSPFHNIYIVYFTICNIIFEMQFVMVLTTCHMSNFSDNKWLLILNLLGSNSTVLVC